MVTILLIFFRMVIKINVCIKDNNDTIEIRLVILKFPPEGILNEV